MFFADEVKQVPKEPAHPELNEAELTMAKTRSTQWSRILSRVYTRTNISSSCVKSFEQKIAGKDIVASTPDVQVNVIDIMEALKQSLAQAGVKND